MKRLILTILSPLLISTLAFAINAPLENAILNKNWKDAIEILEKDDSKVADPTARLLMGHACLATNRNNQSSTLFLSVDKENELKNYLTWAESLSTDNPENAVSHYLLGDAYARLGKRDKAEEALKKSAR